MFTPASFDRAFVPYSINQFINMSLYDHLIIVDKLDIRTFEWKSI
jgi:hypothetical protein